MGSYDPQRDRPRPRPRDDEPAPVESLLGGPPGGSAPASDGDGVGSPGVEPHGSPTAPPGAVDPLAAEPPPALAPGAERPRGRAGGLVAAGAVILALVALRRRRRRSGPSS